MAYYAMGSLRVSNAGVPRVKRGRPYEETFDQEMQMHYNTHRRGYDVL